jgi:formamidopyrimidine-DNA glycosylase
MPEGLEAEIYRRAVEHTVGRTIDDVAVDDRQTMAFELRRCLPGRAIVGARRHGKLVLVELDDGAVLGLHFGMTGRLVVDEAAAIDELEYSSRRDDPAWNRLVITFADGTSMRVNDPRRWAVFTLDPDVEHLGPDVFDLTADLLASRLTRRTAAIKAVLLDQSTVAGFGNMCIDEVLWHAGVSPMRRADELDSGDLESIADATREHLPAMLARGGSHTGTIDPAVRANLPPCPRDGTALSRDTVGGRTTIWCRVHQT